MSYECKICGEKFEDSEEVLGVDHEGKYHSINLLELKSKSLDISFYAYFVCNSCLEKV